MQRNRLNTELSRADSEMTVSQYQAQNAAVVQSEGRQVASDAATVAQGVGAAGELVVDTATVLEGGMAVKSIAVGATKNAARTAAAELLVDEAAPAAVNAVEKGGAVEAGTIAPNAMRQTGSGFFTGSADEAYNAIRASSTDVNAIAKNTGIKPENIQKVKDHLFYQDQLLDRYVDYGIPAETRPFDSDLGIANAWKRLEQGTYTPADLQLLRHEAAESHLMTRWGDPSYNRAHNRAQQSYPAPNLED